MAIVCRVLVALALMFVFNNNQALADEKPNVVKYGFGYIEQNGKSRIMSPNETWFFLEIHVNEAIIEKKELKDDKRIFKKADWSVFEKQIHAVKKQAKSLPRELERVFDQDIELIDKHMRKIEKLNRFLNTEEAKAFVLEEISQIMDICEDIFERSDRIRVKSDSWSVQIYNLWEEGKKLYKGIIVMME